MGEPLSEDEFNALHALLQDAALAAYPNPHRHKCPGSDTLREVSVTRWSASHPAYEHIAHCSPCLSEMLAFRKQEAGQRKWAPLRGAGRGPFNTFKRRRGAYAAAAVFTAATVFFFWGSVPRERLGFQAAIINFAMALDRGTAPNETTPGTEVQIYPQAVVMMRVNLPRGSDDGMYDFEIVDPTIQKTVVKTQGHAHIENGLTTFQAKVNLSNLPRGAYSARERRPPLGGWRAVPIRVQ